MSTTPSPVTIESLVNEVSGKVDSYIVMFVKCFAVLLGMLVTLFGGVGYVGYKTHGSHSSLKKLTSESFEKILSAVGSISASASGSARQQSPPGNSSPTNEPSSS